MCMKFNFISICTYLCGVCPMYCSCSNYFGPNEFGYHFVLEFVLGTLEMHWKLVSFRRKVLSRAYWSQTRMIVNSYLLHHQCYLGNKYLPHAYFYRFSTLCRLFHGMNLFCCNSFGSCKTTLLQMWASRDDYISRGIYT